MKLFILILIIFIACESSTENKLNQQFMHSNHFRFDIEKDGTLGVGPFSQSIQNDFFFAYREPKTKTMFDRNDSTNLPYLDGGGLLISVPSRNYLAPNFRTRYGQDMRYEYNSLRKNAGKTEEPSFYKNVDDTIVQSYNIYGSHNSAAYEQSLKKED